MPVSRPLCLCLTKNAIEENWEYLTFAEFQVHVKVDLLYAFLYAAIFIVNKPLQVQYQNGW